MSRESLFPRVSSAAAADGTWQAPVESTVAVLELTASEQPELLKFQIHVLCNSTMRFTVQQLAAALGVSQEQVSRAVLRASEDLDRLEKYRKNWRDPAKVLDSPNLAALLCVCHARSKRVSKPTRRRRLEMFQRRIERAHELARSRAWIEDFIGLKTPK